MANAFSRTCRSLTTDTSRVALVVWGFAITMLATWLAWFLFGTVTVYEVSAAARLEVERAARPVAAPVAGKILSSSIQLRRQVAAGEVLVELDARTERLRLLEEESRIEAIPPQLAALERQIAAEERAATRTQVAASNALQQARARHEEALASAQFAAESSRRLSQLGGDGRVAEIEALRARAETARTRSAADALALEVKRLQAETLGRNDEKRAALEALRREAAALDGQRELATATIARLRQDIEKRLIRAPVAGVIGEASALDAGNFVDAGAVIASLVPSERLKVVANFAPARVLGRVLPGQTAQLRLEGFPWMQFGTVALTVAQVASEMRNGYIRVELRPNPEYASELLQHGLPGTVEVEIERTSPVSLLLRAAGQRLTHPSRQAAGKAS